MTRIVIDCEPLSDTEASVLRFELLRTAREFLARRTATRERIAKRMLATQKADAQTARLYTRESNP